MIKAILVAMILIAGCASLEDKHDTDDLITLDDVALKCDIDRIYYLKDKFVFHINTKGDEVIYSPVGSYTKIRERPNWTLRLFIGTEDTLYFNTIDWMISGTGPLEESIECVQTNTIPANFHEFIVDHRPFFRNVTVAPLEGTPYN